MRLSLGTAQFGLDYGITNSHGQVSPAQVEAVLETALTRGITDIDTAAAYGNAEAVLASSHVDFQAFDITSKIPALSGLTLPQALSTIEASVCTSAEHLGPSLNSILFHSAADVLGPEGLLYWQKLEDVAAQYGAQHIGVSIYDSGDVAALLKRVTPSAVQLPINVLDQRLLLDGTLETLTARGVHVQARSVFLQGALLSVPATLPGPLRALEGTLTALNTAAKDNGCEVMDLCLGFLKLTGLLESAVVGVTNAAELIMICDAMERPVAALPYQNFSVCEPTLIDPRYWSNPQQRRQST
ncbi:MAG: aldo/keto reductase [Pseudomonadota bacterium]